MSFAQNMNLKPGDVVIVPKSEFNVVEHYVIYGGINYFGHHFYYENIRIYGVRTITESQFAIENPTYNRIRKFTGNEYERGRALERAKSLIGKEYSLAKFNCEDYANYVQYNRAYSKQTDNAAAGFFILSLFLLIAALAGGEGTKS